MALIQSQMIYLTVAICVLNSFIVNSEPIRTIKPDVNRPETEQDDVNSPTTESTILKASSLKPRDHHHYDMGYGYGYGYAPGFGYPMMGGYDYLASLLLFGR